MFSIASEAPTAAGATGNRTTTGGGINSRANPPPFIASATMEGFKQGYIYRTGALGLGYYLDSAHADASRGRAVQLLREYVALRITNANAANASSAAKLKNPYLDPKLAKRQCEGMHAPVGAAEASGGGSASASLLVVVVVVGGSGRWSEQCSEGRPGEQQRWRPVAGALR